MRHTIEIWLLTQEPRLPSGILLNLFTHPLHHDHINHIDLRIQLLTPTRPSRMALRENLTFHLPLSPLIT